uniref:P1 family peptidase n=1 Tax=Shigella flexneri TaxID=623 RepID=UPI0033B38F1F
MQPHHSVSAIDAAHSGPVAEGNVGGGTGMKPADHGSKSQVSCRPPSQSRIPTLSVLYIRGSNDG